MEQVLLLARQRQAGLTVLAAEQQKAQVELLQEQIAPELAVLTVQAAVLQLALAQVLFPNTLFRKIDCKRQGAESCRLRWLHRRLCGGRLRLLQDRVFAGYSVNER